MSSYNVYGNGVRPSVAYVGHFQDLVEFVGTFIIIQINKNQRKIIIFLRLHL